MSAEERREEVLVAAATAFAEGGYEGTSTEDVAHRAGISQPYIFRLFGSKKELFIAVVENCFERVYSVFSRASKGVPAEDALGAMGMAYAELIQDSDVLLVQLQAFTASVTDADVRRVAQAGMRRIWQLAATTSGAGADEVRQWLATGMLCNMICALGLDQLHEPWADDVLPPTDLCPYPVKKLAHSGPGHSGPVHSGPVQSGPVQSGPPASTTGP